MSEAKDFLERESDNTYGIEIEFGTHDNQMLSFTHIEVCYIFIPGAGKEKGWKIETDADYTLELVSPILKFRTQEHARIYRDYLMDFLERRVRTGILLKDLVTLLIADIRTKFTFIRDTWIFTPPAEPLELENAWITNPEMVKALSWENWDEDTDLEQVLAARKIAGDEFARNPQEANDSMLFRMQNVIVTKSRKHGGLPSSQLNLPLSLEAFVRYQTHFKRNKAWDRLLEINTSTPEYIQKKIRSTLAAYPDLAENPVWRAKYSNTDYVESQIDEKTSFWQRYWLWLETFFVCAGHFANSERWNSDADIVNYEKFINDITDKPIYYSVKNAKTELIGVRRYADDLFTANYGEDIAADLLYLTVYKLSAGALSELSETLQMHAQQKIMALNGNIEMDLIKESIPDNQFMQFHYALKDLTSLWFKSPLIDVILAEREISEAQQSVVDTLISKINHADPIYISIIISRVFTAHFKLLGWYHGVCEANNQGFDYDWEDFVSYNMPSIPAFSNSLTKSSTVLVNYLNRLNDPPQQLFTTTNQLRQRYVVFLKRKYEKDEGTPGTPKGIIAPWEGRWDTMKPVIDTDPKKPKYLIEHRNN
jgi:hypothetical protein